MGGKLFDADRQTDRHIGMTKLIVSFRNFANASKIFPSEVGSCVTDYSQPKGVKPKVRQRNLTRLSTCLH
jgi:hypothetical protein